MLDAVLLEQSGVAAAVICTEPFASSGHAMAAAHGMPLYPFALVPHPLATATDAELRAWAGNVAPRVAAILLAGK